MKQINPNIYVESEVANELVSHVRNRTTDMADQQLRVPISHFTSPERAAAEIDLMKRLPLIIGHASEVPNTGDFVTRTILDTPLIIVRQSDGSVATFRNMCRHRGGVVEQEASGNKRTFMCQYHGWSYDAEGGGLKPVFYEDSFGDIDYACSGLHRVKTEVRHGLIFGVFNPDPTAPSIAEYLGPDVDAQIAPWKVEESVLYLDETFIKPMNWKLVMDGAIDPLHPLFLHNKPDGVGERTLNNTAVFRAYGRHGKMFAARSNLKKLVETTDGAGVSYRHVGSVMVLFPNSLFVNAPEHVEFWTVWPTPGNPTQCTVNIRFFVRREIITAEMESRVRKSWNILSQAALDEDFPMEAAIQTNALALGEGSFRYGRNEKPPQHLHMQLREALGDA